MSRVAQKKSVGIRSVQAGFSLIELMIAMLLGLFLLGGVLTVFASNQHTAQLKQRLDGAQEAVRFGSYTISRLVRNADVFTADSTSSRLVLRFPPDIMNVPGCTHANIVGGQVLTLSVNNVSRRLVCDSSTIALGVVAARFEYGFLDASGAWVTSSPDDSATTSVKVAMSVQPDDEFSVQEVVFVATIRQLML